MIQEAFANENSLIHRLDPRFKVIFATIFSVVTACSHQLMTLLAALVISILLAVLSKLNLSCVIKRLLVVNAFVALLWLVLPLTFDGTPVYRLGSLAVALPGILLCLQITLKSNGIVIALISLLATMPFATLGHALHQLHLPVKLVTLLMMTYRYVFVIEEEYLRLTRAMKMRNFRPGTNLHTYRTYAYLIGMLFVRALARAEKVQQAMLCRGFKGKFYSLGTFSPQRADWICAIVMTTMLAGLLLLESILC